MDRLSVNPKVINEVNRNLIKGIIFKDGPISKPQISRMTKLSLPTVNKITGQLQAENIVRVHSIGESNGGRKPAMFVANENAGYICTVLIQGTHVYSQISSIIGETLKSYHVTIDTFMHKDVTGMILDTIQNLLTGYNEAQVKIIGIGVPGVVCHDGTIKKIPTIPQFENHNLKNEIQKVYHTNVIVENDVNLSTVAIMNEKARESNIRNIVYLYIGKGVGMGIVIDGKLYKGSDSLAGEVGIMVTGSDMGFLNVRNAFTFEIFQILNSIFQDEENFDFEKLKSLFENPVCFTGELESIVRLTSTLVINTFCFLDPDAIIIDGDLICQPLIKRIRKNLDDYLGEGFSSKLSVQENKNIGIEGVKQYCLEIVNAHTIVITNG